jgi:energy-coupling factor transporter ATP-binding protein EcfA2
MRLSALVIERDNSAGTQVVEGLRLGAQNLVVGLNASGKSTVVRGIQTLAALVAGEIRPARLTSRRVRWLAEFQSSAGPMTYDLEISDQQVLNERVELGGVELLHRKKGEVGRIQAVKTGNSQNEVQTFETPTTDLAVVYRQDPLNHPFLVTIAKWGSSVYAFGGQDDMESSAPTGPNALVMVGPPPAKTELIRVRPETPIILLLQKGLLSPNASEFKQSIIADMHFLGFEIEDIGLKTFPELMRSIGVQFQSANPSSMPTAVVPIGLFVKEHDLTGVTEQLALSSGMFRALVIVCHLNSFRFAVPPSCIVVDDIGLGLDFERSCALIKLLLKRTEELNIQVVMSSNDRFAMNAVPIEKWTVLRRTGGKVNAYNYFNSREVFDEFKDTGLNNFDFLRMDFADPEAKKETVG